MNSNTAEQAHQKADKLRFLFIPRETFPTYRVDVTELFAEQLSAKGHRIDWIFRSEEHCRKDYTTTWNGQRVWVGPTDTGTTPMARIRKHFYAFINDFKLFNLVAKNEYDFIQVKDKFLTSILALIAGRMKKIPFYLWISFPLPENSLYGWKEKTARYPLYNLFRGLFQKWILYKVICPLSDHIFVQSEQMKRDFMAEGIDPDKMTAVPMGFTPKAALPAQRPTDIGADNKANKSILYLGTLSLQRRIDFVIRAFALVLKQYDNVTLYIVGDSERPADKEMLEALAHELGLDEKVVFTGFLPHEQALGYVETADVCVSPYFPSPVLNSTSPTKLIEYMSYGKAVVANDHPEQREIIGLSGCGYCVPYEETAFAEAIVKLLLDKEAAINMGLAGKTWVENNRTYSILAEQLEKKYYQLLATS